MAPSSACVLGYCSSVIDMGYGALSDVHFAMCMGGLIT